jgi:DNA-binding transcriptional regulator YdaS (Cro superfamily)
VSQAEFQTLEYAAKLFGGEDQLAIRLGVTRAEIDRWISGEEKPPLTRSGAGPSLLLYGRAWL